MSFLGATIKANQSVAGRAAVYVGATAAGFGALPTAMYSVGACDGTVSISPNQDIIKLQRSDGQNPYAVLETAYDFQVTFNLQEVDVFNLALACGYNVIDEAFADISGGYNPDTSGHHGILHSEFSGFTGRSGGSQIGEILVSGTGNPDTAKITLHDTADNSFDGLDIDANKVDYVILSGITNAGISALNGVPLAVSTAEVDGVIFLDIGSRVDDGIVTAATYGTNDELGQLRRIPRMDDAKIVYTSATDIKLVIDIPSDEFTEAGFIVGDSFSIRGTAGSSGTGSAAGDTLNWLQELNGYPLEISATATSSTEQTITADITNISTATANVSHTAGTEGNQLLTLGYIDLTRQLVLGSDSQAGYRSLMIRVEGGMFDNAGGASGIERQVAEWQFYKTKLVYGGSIDYDRTGAVSYPVVAHCLGNSNDVIGQFITPSEFTRTSYYGES